MITLLDLFLPDASRRSRPARPQGSMTPAQQRLRRAELFGPELTEDQAGPDQGTPADRPTTRRSPAPNRSFGAGTAAFDHESDSSAATGAAARRVA